MRHRNKVWMAVFAFCAALSACAKSSAAAYTRITQEEAEKIMKNESGIIILDVRTRSEYSSEHIPGAICIPVEEIGGNPPSQLPDKAQKILIYCRSGNRSRQAAEKLAALGYTNVLEFGGINTWTGETVRENESDMSPVLILDRHAPQETNGVTFEVTGYADNILTARITNNSGDIYWYGEAFALYRKENGEWQEMKWDEERYWIEIAYGVENGKSQEVNCDISGISGVTSGEYMLVKDDLKTEFQLVYTE